MKQHNRHITIAFLLGSYMLLGVLGHVEALTLFGLGTDPDHILRTIGGPPPTGKTYWTQYKHIPSTFKISVPSPAILTTPATPHTQTFESLCTLDVVHVRFDFLISLHSSRAPPHG